MPGTRSSSSFSLPDGITIPFIPMGSLNPSSTEPVLPVPPKSAWTPLLKDIRTSGSTDNAVSDSAANTMMAIRFFIFVGLLALFFTFGFSPSGL